MPSSRLSALVADPSSASRLSLRQILQGMDIDRVDIANSVPEARRKLLESRFDIVLCEFNFNGEETGQDLLEELRGKGALPPSTIFVVITAERSYSSVMGIAEEAPDEYLLKPVNAGDLSERLERAFSRREALMDVYEALQAKQPEKALKAARQVMSSKSRYITDAARLASQVLHRLGRYEEAIKLYQAILSGRDLPWAKFGLARVAMKQGDHETAEAAMRDIMASHSLYLPVYNQLADLYVSQQRLDDALGVVEQAIKVTPKSLKRLQQAGQLAQSIGDKEKTNEYLQRALRVHDKPAELDFRSLFHLLVIQLEHNNAGEAASLVKQIGAKIKAQLGLEPNPRGQWYGELAFAVESISKREPLSAIDRLQKLSKHWQAPQLDLEFVLDYLQVVDRLYAPDIANTLAGWIEPMAYRFNVGQKAQELMVQRVAKREALVAVINAAGESISQTASAAARSMVDQDFRAAADMLIAEGQRLRNNRLLLAAANSAAKCVQQLGDADYRASVETCLSLMYPPPDPQVLRRLTATMG